MPGLATELIEQGCELKIQDLQGLTPIHHAIEFCQPQTFAVLLDYLMSSGFEEVNSTEADLTLASFCVINQSWYCFAELLRKVGRDTLKSKPC